MLVRMLTLFALWGSAAVAGERPPHHTASGFQNVPAIPMPPAGATLSFFAGRIAARFQTPVGMPVRVGNDGAVVRANATGTDATITWIGHASFLVQMDGVTFLTDPTWSDTASPVSLVGPRRFVEPGLAFDALPPIDFVVVSHSHYDHLDLDTLRRLSNGRTRFLVPLRLKALLESAEIGPVEELDWWSSATAGAVRIHCVPAQHWSQRGVLDRDLTLWSGWAVVGPRRRFYFAGDTGYFPGFKEIGARLGPFDLAAVPIGAYAPPAVMHAHHMNPEEAVRAGLDLTAYRMVGMHYGTFDLTDEPLDEPPRRFHDEGARHGLPTDRLWTPAVGETRWW